VPVSPKWLAKLFDYGMFERTLKLPADSRSLASGFCLKNVKRALQKTVAPRFGNRGWRTAKLCVLLGFDI
jgi:hypothetical protein